MPDFKVRPTLNSVNIATEDSLISALTFGDFYNDLVAAGSVPATSANLTTTTPQQTLYVGSKRLIIASQAHTYGASTTTYIDATPAGGFVYTTNAAPTAGNLRAFSVVTSGTAITAVNDLRPRSPFETYITALMVTWNSPGTNANNLSVSSGAAWIEGLGRIVSVPTSLSPPSSTPLTANTWYYMYLYVDANGQPQVEFVTTAPAAAYRGSARSKTGDNTRRLLFAARTDGAGTPAIMAFSHRYNGEVIYTKFSNVSGPYRVISGAAIGVTDATQSLAGVAPPGLTESVLAMIFAGGAAGLASFLIQLGTGGTLSTNFHILANINAPATGYPANPLWAPVIPATPSIIYTTAGVTGQTFFLDVSGYRFVR